MPSDWKVTLTAFGASQTVLLAHFQKRGKDVNFASYCEVLLKHRDAIRRKCPGQLARVALLHHDNVRPHTARGTQQRIRELQWELLDIRKLFADDEEVEVGTQKSKDFYVAGFDALVMRWDKCINVGGGYFEK
jgi:hypothetical protein